MVWKQSGVSKAMPIRTEPTLPSAEEAILARAASRALEEHRDDPSL